MVSTGLVSSGIVSSGMVVYLLLRIGVLGKLISVLTHANTCCLGDTLTLVVGEVCLPE